METLIAIVISLWGIGIYSLMTKYMCDKPESPLIEDHPMGIVLAPVLVTGLSVAISFGLFHYDILSLVGWCGAMKTGKTVFAAYMEMPNSERFWTGLIFLPIFSALWGIIFWIAVGIACAVTFALWITMTTAIKVLMKPILKPLWRLIVKAIPGTDIKITSIILSDMLKKVVERYAAWRLK